MSLRAVAIGGGHGLTPALQALLALGVEPSAVVTVADDGGSTGRLRADLGIIAPGDLRMALLTLAGNRELAEAMAHRFQRGELEGHPLGNLLLVALQEMAGGDALAGLETAGRLLDARGRVLPATQVPVHLCAKVGGREVRGQVRVATADAPIERVWVEPLDAPATAAAVTAIGAADLVVLGPGSLYTSVIATLVVAGIGQAVEQTRARVVYVANLWQQEGEAAGLGLGEHVAALLAHVPGLHLDSVIAHDGPLPPEAEAVAGPLPTNVNAEVRYADLVARGPDATPTWRHDVRRLADALEPLLKR